MLIAYEANGGLRQIFLDGRAAARNDPQPLWRGLLGRAAGTATRWWWNSSGFRDDGWLDVDGSYFGTTTTITERFRRVNYGRLELDVTVEDAKAYTRPWTVRVNYRLLPDQQLIEFVCSENEQSSNTTSNPEAGPEGLQLRKRSPCLFDSQCKAFLDQIAAGRRTAAASAVARRGARAGPCRPSSPAPSSRCISVEDHNASRVTAA